MTNKFHMYADNGIRTLDNEETTELAKKIIDLMEEYNIVNLEVTAGKPDRLYKPN